jgi:hypothetical protein
MKVNVPSMMVIARSMRKMAPAWVVEGLAGTFCYALSYVRRTS